MRNLPLLLFALLSLAGCGSSTGSSDAPAFDKVHPPDWFLAHDAEAKDDPIGCQVCHGEDFLGMANAVSCLSCHMGGPPFFVHPPPVVQRLEWRHPINHGTWVKRDIAACQGCHGNPDSLRTPGSDPRFARPIRRMELGCESVEGCHDNGNVPFPSLDNGHNPRTAHPSRDPADPAGRDRMHWYGERLPYVDDAGREQVQMISHYNAGNLPAACALCHGAVLEGGMGPACTGCHVLPPLENPARCVSCHGLPPVAPAETFRILSGRQESLDPLFVAEVKAGFHLAHDILACADHDTVEDCRGCHLNEPLAGTDPRTNINRHHLLVKKVVPEETVLPPAAAGALYACLSCHPMTFDPRTFSWDMEVIRDCAVCHRAPFPAVLPCPP